MQVFFIKKTAFWLLLFVLLGPAAGGAQDLRADIRTAPVAVNLIVDGSLAFKDAGNGPADWLCDYFVERILSGGDYLTVWNAAESARIVFSGTVQSGGGKEEIKKIIRAMSFSGGEADFTGALREAAAKRPEGSAAWTCTLLVTGSPGALVPPLLGSSASLLRYSRVDEYPGWRVLTIALDIRDRVNRAAAAYMAGN
ncbi:MAG: hypothetical protein LBL44_07050 [Treponema sp.]|jgi:hypothetical protein|nr:hypothetical protein [Treponema sp.]